MSRFKSETDKYGMNYLLVFLGGGLGSVCRYGISVAILGMGANSLPLGTFFSNVLSCMILAFTLWILGLEHFADEKWIRLSIVVGFCGGFSTFSTFSLETIQLIKNGNHLVAAGNVILSVVICLILLYRMTK